MIGNGKTDGGAKFGGLGEPPLENKTGVPNNGPQGDLNSVPVLLKLN